MNHGRFMAIITLLIVSIFCTSIVQSEENSSDYISLESGVLVSGYVTESDKSNPEDQYVIQVSEGDVVEFTITSEELIDFCVYLAPTGQELVCYYEMNNRDEITFVKKESTERYVIKINCESTSYQCSESADYTLLVTAYADEAGDYIEDSTPIIGPNTVSGIAFLDENANPIDHDFYFLRVNPQDNILVIIASNDFGTSYRVWDEKRTVLISEFENAPYDFQLNVPDGTYLFIEIWCQQNYGQHCSYTIDVLGSTYQEDEVEVIADSSALDTFSTCFGLIIIGLIGIIYSEGQKKKGKNWKRNQHLQQVNTYNNSIQQANFQHQQQHMISQIKSMDIERKDALKQAEQMRKEILLLEKEKQDAIKEAELEKMKVAFERIQRLAQESEKEKEELQRQLDNAKSSNIVQNVTYNIQDSAISGDINNPFKEQDDS